MKTEKIKTVTAFTCLYFVIYCMIWTLINGGEGELTEMFIVAAITSVSWGLMAWFILFRRIDF